MGSRTQAVYPSKLLRQNGPRLTPADRRYWEEVRDENLRLFHTIQVNSGAKPHHADRGNSVSFAPEVKPLLRSQTPSEKKYWRGVETENLRLLNRILKIQGYAKRSRSVSTPPSYPYPKPSILVSLNTGLKLEEKIFVFSILFWISRPDLRVEVDLSLDLPDQILEDLTRENLKES
ncbi:uncharacterized protein LOC111708091 isoform X3 [Eurytemora carolleeae]|uniref:uncharacterized protein LOC111708091 isoform X3 n=1 Tax=Eurytemora carolleeae TaxID=1294199 RepID=UPI000C755DD9|nr:uncharacterized protein LOC111708091 isoform X3 [Eurytemora carolleeae]|eukprot:XP_023337125.1 uncharacterized protein LOC111708091 isoform X3 [Eurytemora affinis]